MIRRTSRGSKASSFSPIGGVIEQRFRRPGKLLNDPSRSFGRYRAQMFMEAHQVRRRLAGPLYLHFAGGGSGLSVLRLSAHD